jgi:hypothetical protein
MTRYELGLGLVFDCRNGQEFSLFLRLNWRWGILCLLHLSVHDKFSVPGKTAGELMWPLTAT